MHDRYDLMLDGRARGNRRKLRPPLFSTPHGKRSFARQTVRAAKPLLRPRKLVFSGAISRRRSRLTGDERRRLAKRSVQGLSANLLVNRSPDRGILVNNGTWGSISEGLRLTATRAV